MAIFSKEEIRTRVSNCTGTLSFHEKEKRIVNFHFMKSRVLVGAVTNDSKGRFPDGTTINTSDVVLFAKVDEKFYALTTYSTYEVLLTETEIRDMISVFAEKENVNIPFVTEV